VKSPVKLLIARGCAVLATLAQNIHSGGNSPTVGKATAIDHSPKTFICI